MPLNPSEGPVLSCGVSTHPKYKEADGGPETEWGSLCLSQTKGSLCSHPPQPILRATSRKTQAAIEQGGGRLGQSRENQFAKLM